MATPPMHIFHLMLVWYWPVISDGFMQPIISDTHTFCMGVQNWQCPKLPANTIHEALTAVHSSYGYGLLILAYWRLISK